MLRLASFGYLCEIKMEKVSIIMPLYNCEKFLKHSIQSVQNQTYDNWELIIVDDASTDNSLEEAQLLAEKDSHIHIHSLTQNKGVGYARNVAISFAKGRYLAFLDSDDLWAKHKLEKQIDFMQSDDIGLSHTGYAFIDEKGQLLPTGIIHVDQSVNLLRYLKTTQIGMSTVMIDRKKFPNISFPSDRRLSEDASTWVPLLRQGEYFHGMDEVLMLYRVRENQLSSNKIKMAKRTFQRYMNEDSIPFYKRLSCFFNYAYHGVEKRVTNNNLNQALILENFNCRAR